MGQEKSMVETMMFIAAASPKEILVKKLLTACERYLENKTETTESELDFQVFMLGMQQATKGSVEEAMEIIKEMNQVSSIKEMIAHQKDN